LTVTVIFAWQERAGMIITSKSDYGLRAGLELARMGKRVRLREIASRQHIPEAVCAQILRRLVMAGIARSTAGPAGGYELARPAESISVAEVLTASDRDICVFRCVDDGCDCELSGRCAFQLVLRDIGRDLAERLEGMTLAELSDAQQAMPLLGFKLLEQHEAIPHTAGANPGEVTGKGT
jgi:Rrf2 family transcriptional regulator, iron-sulfur cluster assembly transcription factor